MRLVKLPAILYYQGPKIIKGYQTIVSKGTGTVQFFGIKGQNAVLSSYEKDFNAYLIGDLSYLHL